MPFDLKTDLGLIKTIFTSTDPATIRSAQQQLMLDLSTTSCYEEDNSQALEKLSDEFADYRLRSPDATCLTLEDLNKSTKRIEYFLQAHVCTDIDAPIGTELNYLSLEDQGKTLMQIALENNDRRMVQFLVYIYEAGFTIQLNGKNKNLLELFLEKEDLTAAETLLEVGNETTNNQDEAGNSYLMRAIAAGNLTAVRFLLRPSWQTDPNQPNNDGDTPLHIAANLRDIYIAAEITQLLIQAGANAKAQNKKKVTPMHLAAQNSHIGVIRCLAKQKASNFVQDNESNSPYVYAARNGKTASLRVLAEIENEEAIELPLTQALHAAALHNQTNVVRIIVKDLKQSVDVCNPFDEETALHKVAQTADCTKIADTLLALNADINAINTRMDTPLHKAAAFGSLKNVQYLVEHKAEVSARNHFGAQPIHLVAQRQDENALEIMQWLLEHAHADVHAKDREQNNLLHLAAKTNQEQVHQFLIHILKADQCIYQNKWGYTPLHAAIKENNLDYANLLVQANPKLLEIEDNDGNSPLHLAAKLGRLDIVRWLVNEKKVDITRTNHKKETALHMAVLIERAENAGVVTFLLAQEIPHKSTYINAVDHKGRTALQKAILKGNITCAKAWTEKRYFTLKTKDPNGNEKNAIDYAVINGSKKMAKWLQNGTEVPIRVSGDTHMFNGDTAFQLAASLGHAEMLKFFLASDPNLLHKKNKDGNTPLHLAAAAGVHKDEDEDNDDEIEGEIGGESEGEIEDSGIRFLLDQDSINLKATNIKGNTPFLEACEKGNTDGMYQLYEGSSQCEKNNNGDYFLHLLFAHGHSIALNHLLEKFNVILFGDSAQNAQGKIPLHLAAQNGFTEFLTIKQLKESVRKTLLTVDSEGNSAFHLAAQNGRVKFLQTLGPIHISMHDIGYRSNRNSQGKSPLHLAAQNGHVTVMEYLDQGFLIQPDELTRLDSQGNTLLHLAVEGGHKEMVKWLLIKERTLYWVSERQKPLQTRNLAGQLPLQIAESKGESHAEIAKWLRDLSPVDENFLKETYETYLPDMLAAKTPIVQAVMNTIFIPTILQDAGDNWTVEKLLGATTAEVPPPVPTPLQALRIEVVEQLLRSYAKETKDELSTYDSKATATIQALLSLFTKECELYWQRLKETAKTASQEWEKQKAAWEASHPGKHYPSPKAEYLPAEWKKIKEEWDKSHPGEDYPPSKAEYLDTALISVPTPSAVLSDYLSTSTSDSAMSDDESEDDALSLPGDLQVKLSAVSQPKSPMKPESKGDEDGMSPEERADIERNRAARYPATSSSSSSSSSNVPISTSEPQVEPEIIFSQYEIDAATQACLAAMQRNEDEVNKPQEKKPQVTPDTSSKIFAALGVSPYSGSHNLTFKRKREEEEEDAAEDSTPSTIPNSQSNAEPLDLAGTSTKAEVSDPPIKQEGNPHKNRTTSNHAAFHKKPKLPAPGNKANKGKKNKREAEEETSDKRRKAVGMSPRSSGGSETK